MVVGLRANEEQNGVTGFELTSSILGKFSDDSFESEEKTLLKIGPLCHYFLYFYNRSPSGSS